MKKCFLIALASILGVGVVEGAVNTATLSADVNWSAIPWQSAYDASSPVQLTLSKDVRLTFDQDPLIVELTVLGGHRLTLVPTKVPMIDSIVAENGSTLAIQGGSAASPVVWASPMHFRGRLSIVGVVALTASSSSIGGTGMLVVESGTLNLGRNRLDLCDGLTLELNGGSTITGDGDGLAAIDLNGAESITVNGTGTARISAPVRFRADSPVKNPSLTIASGAVFALDTTVAADGGFSDPSGWAVQVKGGGSVAIGLDASLPAAADGFCSGGVSGTGEIVFTADPKGSGVTTSLAAAAWSGRCTFRDMQLTDFSPATYGNAGSKVRFEGVDVTLTAKAKFGPALEMGEGPAAKPYGLALTAADAATITLDTLTGAGKLVLRDAATSGAGARVFVMRDFGGSLKVEGARGGIVVGADTTELQTAAFGVCDGMIAAVGGTAVLQDGASWEAVNGIYVRKGAAIEDHGELMSPVKGEGTVYYRGEVPARLPESSAAFTDATAWSGVVHFLSATLQGCDLSCSGNTNSTVLLENSSGRMAGTTVPVPVQLRGNGFRVTDAEPLETVTLSAIAGNGAFIVSSGSKGSGSTYRILDVSNHSGSIEVTSSTGCSVVFGGGVRAGDGVLQVSDGFSMRSKRNWTATRVVFGRTVYITGANGDAVLSVTGPNVDFRTTKVHLVNASVDIRRCYKLEFDAKTKKLLIAETVSPPTADVASVDVRYGADFTNATISVTVTNFWGGYDFMGQAVARYRVYNASGRAVASGDCVITGNGSFEVGTAGLANGKGADFRYEVEIVALDEAGTVIDTIKTLSFGRPAVHGDGSWFAETPETFAAGGVDGVWSYIPGQAYVTNETAIAVRALESGENVRFSPTNDVTDGVVEVKTEVVFDSAVVLSAVDDPVEGVSRLAGLTVAMPEDPRKTDLFYAVWVPDAELPAGGRFVAVEGLTPPSLGTPHVVGWQVNYQTGRVTYSVDGEILCDTNGVSSFPIPDTLDRAGQGVCYSGVGYVKDLVGEKYNANLAALTKDGVTTQYDTVEEAVAAAEGGKVALLWDATWKPVFTDVGRVVSFDTDGHELTVDPATTNRFAREGYFVNDLGDGNYRIDVITYYVNFDINGGNTGSMDPQPFSVTNLVFALAENGFAKEGFDFANWNRLADGSDPTNWSDGATIDMTPYGLADMTLYAQWQVAVRTIVVEAADEFVYIERVLTNDVVHTGVRYFQEDAGKATGKAAIPVINGSDLVIRFSTDLEKRLTYEYIKATEAVVKDGTITKDELPEVYQEGINEILDPVHEWAASRGISFAALSASAFSQSSYRLNLDQLLTTGSNVEIGDFSVRGDGCSFRVKIDGQHVTDVARLLPMIRVADTLVRGEGGWSPIQAGDVAVGEDGLVVVHTGKFVKIVIPQND